MPTTLTDVEGRNPLLFIAAVVVVYTAFDALQQGAANDWHWECVDPFRLAGAGVHGVSEGIPFLAGGWAAKGVEVWVAMKTLRSVEIANLATAEKYVFLQLIGC